MCPGEPTSIELKAPFLISERIVDRLPRTHSASRELPLPHATIEAHKHVLLDLTRHDIMHDHIASRPAAGLEPELCLTTADAIDSLIERTVTTAWCRSRSGRYPGGSGRCTAVRRKDTHVVYDH